MKKFIITVFVLGVLVVAGWLTYPYIKEANPIKDVPTVSDPLNTTYTIESREVKLVNGTAESNIDGASATKTTTLVFGRPATGDLNNDGVKDSVVFATETGGGSGTFYYALVALNIDGVYKGLKAVYLGDRISPQSILIKDNVAMVNYADRKEGEPMSSLPTVGITKYLTVESNSVKEFNLFNKGEQLFAGHLIMAHEARVFTPCGGTAHWVMGTSTAYSELTKTYNANKSTSTPYSSVFVVVSGIIVSAPTDGFGADYNYGIDVKSLLKTIPGAVCPKI